MSESACEYPEELPDDFETSPGKELVEYLQGSFGVAYEDKFRAIDFNIRAIHGALVRTIHSDDSTLQLTKNQDRVIFKLPHPQDRPGDFYEVFALDLPAQSREARANDYGAYADLFLIREHVDGTPGGFLLADKSGVSKVDIDSMGSIDELIASGTDPFAQELETLILTEHIFSELSRRHLVSSTG